MPAIIRRSTPYPNQRISRRDRIYSETLQACRNAIARRELPNSIAPYQPSELPNYFEQTQEALRWIQDSRHLQLIYEYQGHWDIGDILYKIEQAIIEWSPEEPSLATCAQEACGLNDRQAKTAKRIYRIFGQYALAIKHIRDLPISHWVELSANQMDQLAATIAVEFEDFQITLQEITEDTSYSEESNSETTETSSETEFGYMIQNPETGAYGFQYVSTWAEHLENITQHNPEEADQPGTPDSDEILVEETHGNQI